MASTNSIRVLEVCKVTPPSQSPGSATEVSLPLTYFDIFWLIAPPVERIFFYDLNGLTPTMFNTEILPKLKHSLSCSLLHFLPLAGNLIWPPNSAKPIILYTPKDGVSLTVVESLGAADDFDTLSSHEMHDASMSQLYVPKLSTSDFKSSTIALQITFFPNKGFSIGFTTHHGVLDGKSSILFTKAWAHICKHNSDLLPAELTPFFDRAVVQDPVGLDMEYLNYMSSMKQAAEGSDSNARSLMKLSPPPKQPAPPNSVRATFTFSREDIKKLREKMLSQLDKVTYKKETEGTHLSSFVLIFSYAIFCIAKAKGVKSDEKIKFGFVADCRARLNPPIPINYFGNCDYIFAAILKAGAVIQDDGLLLLVQKVSEMIKGLEKGALEVATEKVKQLFAMEPAALTVGVAGSARFEVYGVDFGWGRPKNVEITSIGTGAISIAESKAESGGVEIGLVLQEDVMETFQNLFVNGLKDV